MTLSLRGLYVSMCQWDMECTGSSDTIKWTCAPWKLRTRSGSGKLGPVCVPVHSRNVPRKICENVLQRRFVFFHAPSGMCYSGKVQKRVLTRGDLNSVPSSQFPCSRAGWCAGCCEARNPSAAVLDAVLVQLPSKIAIALVPSTKYGPHPGPHTGCPCGRQAAARPNSVGALQCNMKSKPMHTFGDQTCRSRPMGLPSSAGLSCGEKN